MRCEDIKFGTYDCAYNIMPPYYVTDINGEKKTRYVAIDKCLIREILDLWEEGIKTTGCCCGHGDASKAFIGAKAEYIERMKELGYTIFINQCRPGDEDSFTPKTAMAYGDIKKGFNWWD